MPRLREGDTFSTGGKSWKSSEWWRSFCGELLWSFWERGDDNNVDWKNCTDMGGVEWLWEAESLKLTVVRITGTPLIPHTRYQKLALGDLVQLHLVQHHHQSQGSLLVITHLCRDRQVHNQVLVLELLYHNQKTPNRQQPFTQVKVKVPTLTESFSTKWEVQIILEFTVHPTLSLKENLFI